MRQQHFELKARIKLKFVTLSHTIGAHLIANKSNLLLQGNRTEVFLGVVHKCAGDGTGFISALLGGLVVSDDNKFRRTGRQ
jgi:hypothetical protein